MNIIGQPDDWQLTACDIAFDQAGLDKIIVPVLIEYGKISLFRNDANT